MLKSIAHIPLQASIFFCGGLYYESLFTGEGSSMTNWMYMGLTTGAIQASTSPCISLACKKNHILICWLWLSSAFLSVPLGGFATYNNALIGPGLMFEVIGVSVILGLIIMGMGCLNLAAATHTPEHLNRNAIIIDLPVATASPMPTEGEIELLPSWFSVFTQHEDRQDNTEVAVELSELPVPLTT